MIYDVNIHVNNKEDFRYRKIGIKRSYSVPSQEYTMDEWLIKPMFWVFRNASASSSRNLNDLVRINQIADKHKFKLFFQKSNCKWMSAVRGCNLFFCN